MFYCFSKVHNDVTVALCFSVLVRFIMMLQLLSISVGVRIWLSVSLRFMIMVQCRGFNISVQ